VPHFSHLFDAPHSFCGTAETVYSVTVRFDDVYMKALEAVSHEDFNIRTSDNESGHIATEHVNT